MKRFGVSLSSQGPYLRCVRLSALCLIHLFNSTQVDGVKSIAKGSSKNLLTAFGPVNGIGRSCLSLPGSLGSETVMGDARVHATTGRTVYLIILEYFFVF